MKYRVAKITAIVFLAIVLGFLQENLKVSINYLLETGDKIPTFFQQDVNTKQSWLEQVRVNAPFDYYHNHRRIEWLYHCSRTQLNILKWIVTVFFVVIFMIINALLISWWTRNKKYFKWTIGLYVVFFAFAFVIYLGGHISGTSMQAYGVSRKIVGGLQSLVPLMILIPASWLLKKEIKKEYR